jgi:hypothetical protein
MSSEAPAADFVLPFGRYNGVPLAAVPSEYLGWLLGKVKLSTGIRATVAAELSTRGHTVPPAPPPRPIAPCRRCGPNVGVSVHWQKLRNGQRRLRAECRRCGKFLTYPPSVMPYTTMANAALAPHGVNAQQAGQTDGKR